MNYLSPPDENGVTSFNWLRKSVKRPSIVVNLPPNVPEFT